MDEISFRVLVDVVTDLKALYENMEFSFGIIQNIFNKVVLFFFHLLVFSSPWFDPNGLKTLTMHFCEHWK